MENTNVLETTFLEYQSLNIPCETLAELISYEIESTKGKRGKGMRQIIELLHVLNYAQSLFEELRNNQSKYIYNEYVCITESPKEEQPEEVEADNSEDSPITSALQEENERRLKKKKKSLRQCAYDAYLSSLAPKHGKAIQCE